MINIKIALNQLDIIKVSMGQEVAISFEAIPDALLQGKITEISSTPNSKESSLATYDVIISAARENHPIYSGMNAQVKIVIHEETDVLLVPLTAVSQDSETGEQYVQVIESNGSLTKTPIITGTVSNHQIEVVEGLSEGMKIRMINFDANQYTHTDFTSSY